MARLRVLHLVGSAVSDFYCELSRLYAQDCLENTANPDLYEFHIAYVCPDLGWRFPASLDRSAIAQAPSLSVSEAMAVLAQLQIDVMVPQMFCLPGMTQYRALFDVLEIPYVGNSAKTMALAADKAKSKAVVAAAGVPVPAGKVLHHGDRLPESRPLIIKPNYSDNSLGLSLVTDLVDGDAALENAFRYSDEVLVEAFIELGREVRCGVIVQAGELVCLPLEEYAVNPQTQPIRTYADKLKQNEDGSLGYAAKEKTKAWIVDPSDPMTQRVWAIAKQCHVALGCQHYSLFDFRIDPEGQPWFLEAGLYCSFAEKSVISTMAQAAGISLENLFGSMVQMATISPNSRSNSAPSCWIKASIAPCSRV
jgi:D-alanine-D-alanine ligase